MADQVCRFTITTISVLQQPEHEIEVMIDWEIRQGLERVDEGGLDDIEVLDTRTESLSDFIARSCASIAGEHRQTHVEIVFPSQDRGLQHDADQRRIEGQIRKLLGSRLQDVRFLVG